MTTIRGLRVDTTEDGTRVLDIGAEWALPSIPEFCGPKEVADIICNYRNWKTDNVRQLALPLASLLAQGMDGAIAEPELRALVDLAYAASFTRDEGRTTRIKFIVPNSLQFHQHPRVVAFQPRIGLTHAEVVRRLGPTLSSEDYALEVVTENGQLLCAGMLNLAGDEYLLPNAFSEIKKPGLFSGMGSLRLAILGPGELVLSEDALRIHLRANQILQETTWQAAPLVSDWFAEAAIAIQSQEEECRHARREIGNDLRYALADAWSIVLFDAIDRKHGGCFIVLKDSKAAPVEIKFPIEPVRFGYLVAEYVDAARIAEPRYGEAESSEAIRNAIKLRSVLDSTAKILADVSSTDGCVVLDRELNVIGFGGILTPPTGSHDDRQLIDWKTRNPVDIAAYLHTLGTRHRSALALCRAVPHSIAFVVSQDGELRVFSSDSEHVYKADSLRD